MNIFSYTDYRVFIQKWILATPNGGRGELQRIAKAAMIHASTLSLVLRGDRSLTPEQVVGISDYFSLAERECNYLLLMVQRERAGTERLRSVLTEEMRKLKAEGDSLVHRVPVSTALTEEQKAVFYSNWYYTAARIMSFVDQTQTLNAISARLKLPRALTQEVVSFLVDHGLCVEKGGKILPGPQSTHIDDSSRLGARHHSNWRIKAMEKHPSLTRNVELAFTAPVSLSRKDVLKIREMLAEVIQQACVTIDQSPSEVTYCLNIDWFEF